MRDLKGCFITTADEFKEGAVNVFLQKIKLENIKGATLYVTALGMYEMMLNGKKIGDRMFTPGYTYYHKQLLYQKYDVKDYLNEGENKLLAYLGQGWYCGRFGFDNKVQIYGEKPAISWILEIEQSDNNLMRFSSNENVIVLESPFDYAGIYDGEVYFADRDYNLNGIEKEVGKTIKFNGDIPEIMDETLISVKIQEEMPVQKVIKYGDITILDFGQNFAGIVEIDPSFIEGDVIKIRHGEILNNDGSLYTTNLRKAKAKIVYHKGTSNEKYRPRFTYMGFRYMEVTGVEYKDGMITAYALYSEMTRTGEFSCENTLVQKLYDNQIWGQKSNYVEVPTDCPQRDERMGYTGDGHVFAQTGSYNYDTEQFFTKFLEDIKYSQMDNTKGYIGSTIPAEGPEGIGFLSMLGWGNAVTILPEMLYQQYGEESYLTNQYESMKLFADAEIEKMGKKNLWIGPSLGDWLMLGKKVSWMAMHNNPVSNAFIVHDMKVVSQTARRLGKVDDANYYEDQMEKTRVAYIKKFIKEDGRMKDDYQGAYILALKFVLQEGELKQRVTQRLVENVKEHGMHTGFFGTQHILPILADAGEGNLAYDILLQEDCPGWMYQIKCGATTTWERWDALRPDGTVNEDKMSKDNMVSFNHYAFGSVGEFYYTYILGIKPLKPGFAKILIAPIVDKRLGCVSGSYASKAGVIKVEWQVNDEETEIRLETPTNTVIKLPNGQKYEVDAGSYSYRI
ncbi:MAG: family 78 glycoside hydrolase catalytic domain [Suipraeoptans sp.]